MEEYREGQKRSLLITIASGVVLYLAVLSLYSSDIAQSYGLGASFSVLYLRLLTRSVDATMDGGGSGGPPRLLLPGILVVRIPIKSW